MCDCEWYIKNQDLKYISNKVNKAVLLAIGQVDFIRDLSFSPQLMIYLDQNEWNYRDGP